MIIYFDIVKMEVLQAERSKGSLSECSFRARVRRPRCALIGCAFLAACETPGADDPVRVLLECCAETRSADW